MSLQNKLEEKVKEINGGNGESFEEQKGQELVPAVDGQKQPVNVVPEFAVSLDQARERIQMLQQFVKEYMVQNEDYGLIPGCQRPSLFKPGAEKLCDVYGFSKHVEVTGRLEDWEKPFLHYEVKVTLVNKRSGHVEADGIGNANSREKKFAKQDAYSIANTLLKIAKKRALVDAVLSATRSSGLFTQDIEDMVVMGIGIEEKQQAPLQPEESKPKVSGPVTEGQLKKIYDLARELKFSKGAGTRIIENHYGKSELQQLNQGEAEDLIQKFQDMKQKH